MRVAQPYLRQHWLPSFYQRPPAHRPGHGATLVVGLD
jgi:hypothetical protein